jgi:hypothetical protein
MRSIAQLSRALVALAPFLALASYGEERSSIQLVSRFEGKQVSGLTLCLSPGAGRERILSGSGTRTNARCVPADEPVELAAGHWSAYGFLGTTLAIPMTIDIEVVSGEKRKESVVELVEGGTVRLDGPGLGDAQQLVLYFPPLGTFSELTVPVPIGQSTVTVPRNRAFLPILMQGSTVVAVGKAQEIGESGLVSIPKARDGSFNLIIVPLISRMTVDEVQSAGLSTRPVIRILQDGVEIDRHEITSLNPPDLAIFRDLPFAPTSVFEVEIGGDQWLRVNDTVDQFDGATLVLDGTRETFPVSGLEIRVPSSEQHIRASCATEEPSESRVVLLNCTSILQPGQRVEEVNKDRCSLASEDVVAADDPVTRVGDLRAGSYVVELRSGGQLLGQQLVHLPAGESKEVDFLARSGTLVTGRVSYEDGSSANADIRINQRRAGTDPRSGQYSITISDAVAARVPFVIVRECQSGHETIVLLANALETDSRLDVTLSLERQRLVVRDAVSGKPVENALASIAVAHRFRDPARPRAAGAVAAGRFSSGTSDARGELSVSEVQPPRATELCVEHVDYDRRCLAWTGVVGPALTVALQPRVSQTGRIRVNGAIALGRVAWVRDGIATEMALVNATGEFRYDRKHAADETLVFVSRSHPLFVVPWREDGEISLALPRTMTFSVRTADRRDAMLALEIAGTLIPHDLFTFHQSIRGDLPFVIGGGPLRVADLAVAGAIVVIKGPASDSPELSAFPDADIFTLPQYRRSLPRMVVAGSEVVFD